MSEKDESIEEDEDEEIKKRLNSWAEKALSRVLEKANYKESLYQKLGLDGYGEKKTIDPSILSSSRIIGPVLPGEKKKVKPNVLALNRILKKTIKENKFQDKRRRREEERKRKKEEAEEKKISVEKKGINGQNQPKKRKRINMNVFQRMLKKGKERKTSKKRKREHKDDFEAENLIKKKRKL